MWTTPITFPPHSVVVVVTTKAPKEGAPAADDPEVDPEERERKTDERRGRMQLESDVTISRRERGRSERTGNRRRVGLSHH